MIKEMYNLYKAKRDHVYYYHCNVVLLLVAVYWSRCCLHVHTRTSTQYTYRTYVYTLNAIRRTPYAYHIVNISNIITYVLHLLFTI